ncbi:MAG: DUF6044 family protein [Bacteroidota bacterium]
MLSIIKINNRQSINRIIFRVVVAMLVLLFLPYLLLWDDAYIRIHDTLEGEWIWYHMLVQNGIALDFSADAQVDQVMNGLPRFAYLSGMTAMVAFLNFFGTYGGYIFNYFVVHLIGFAGMYLLLKHHFLKEKHQHYIIMGVALCFAWIPYFTTFGITVAGQPLLFWAFLNIYHNKDRWYDYLVIGGFPFYASLVWGGPALLGVAGLIMLYGIRVNRKLNFRYFLAMVLLLLGFLIVNFQMLELVLFPGDFVTHREEYDFFVDKSLSLGTSLQEMLMLSTITHYHVGTFVTIPIIVAFIWSIYRSPSGKLRYAIAGLIFTIVVFFGFYNWIVYLFGEMLSLLETLKFDRVSILLPFLWCVLFALSLAAINRQRPYSRVVAGFLVIQFLMVGFTNDEFQHNIRQIVGAVKKPNFKNFFAAALFDEVDAHIGQPKGEYRVVSIGINPTIAQYNGFYTLDALQAVYSLDYKQAFRKVMVEELAKDESIRNYFDGWGNRCYLFSAELGKEDAAYMCSKDQDISINDWDIKTEALQELGGDFIFAAVKINNAIQIGLELEKIFEHPDSFWRIYLYRVALD